jgi:hypothetical protein
LKIVKESGSCLTPIPLCSGFLEENFDRGFLTTLGLVLPCLGGSCSAKMSIISLVKKKAVAEEEYLESQELSLETAWLFTFA